MCFSRKVRIVGTLETETGMAACLQDTR